MSLAARPVVTCRVESAGHAFPVHPESPGRFAHFDDVALAPLAGRLSVIESVAVDLTDILRVHSERHLDRLKAAAADAPAYLDYGDTFVTQSSFELARLSAGGALAVVRAVARGEAGAGFALIRPPGHHATGDRAMGFCLLNNVAIAARAVQADGLGRVAIVDFDVHHGNGTQAVFAADPSVLYISTHQWGIYPGTGALEETGEAAGAGTLVNLPFPALAGDRAMRQAMQRVILPALTRFKPDLMLVSAGFDAHWRDPLANLQVTVAGFHELVAGLAHAADELCRGRLVLCLEGGYDPLALAHSVHNAFLALLGESAQAEPWGDPPFEEPSVDSLIDSAVSIHGL